jgi:hypothetical protein
MKLTTPDWIKKDDSPQETKKLKESQRKSMR